MVRLGGDQVAAGDQLVALDGGVVVDGPPIIFENFGEVEGQPVDIMPIGRGRFCQTAYALTGNSSGKTYVNLSDWHVELVDGNELTSLSG